MGWYEAKRVNQVDRERCYVITHSTLGISKQCSVTRNFPKSYNIKGPSEVLLLLQDILCYFSVAQNWQLGRKSGGIEILTLNKIMHGELDTSS